MSTEIERPDFNKYFMQIAFAVRARANCKGNRIGAVAVKSNRIISTGYNGTPENMKNCLDGGCRRCNNREAYASGVGYDICICVHAEQNVLLAAARFGIALEGSTVYTSMRPCFGCTKEMLQAGISGLYYKHPWKHPDSDEQEQYERIQARFADGIRQLCIDDPDETWAVSSLRINPKKADETGHPGT